MTREYWKAKARVRYWVEYGNRYGWSHELLEHALAWEMLANERRA